MAVELKSSFTPGRDLVTQLPGGQATGGYPDLPPALLALLLARASKPTPQPTAAPRVAAQQPSMQNSRPTMGTSQSSSGGGQGAFPKPKITRMRMLDSNQDMLEMRGSAGLPGIKRPRSQVQEEQLPDGSWSLDAVYGTLEGNEAAARQRMAYLQRQENPAMGGRDRGMEDVRRESAVPVNPYNRNNDARGEGYGVDFNNRRPVADDMPRRAAGSAIQSAAKVLGGMR